MENPKIQKNIWKKWKMDKKNCMIILSFFTNLLILLFSIWVGPFPHADELGVSQTSRGKSQPIILIVNLSVYVFQMRMSMSVTEFSEVSSLLSSPHLFICKSWGVVVVVGGCGGTDSGTKASTPSSLSSLFLWMLLNEWKSSWLAIVCWKWAERSVLLLLLLLLLKQEPSSVKFTTCKGNDNNYNNCCEKFDKKKPTYSLKL